MEQKNQTFHPTFYTSGKQILALREEDFFGEINNKFKSFEFDHHKKLIAVFRIVQRNFLTNKMLLTTFFLGFVAAISIFWISLYSYLWNPGASTLANLILFLLSIVTLIYTTFQVFRHFHKLQQKKRLSEFFVKNLHTGNMIFDLPFIPQIYLENKLTNIRLKWLIVGVLLYPITLSLFIWYGSLSPIENLRKFVEVEFSPILLNKKISSLNVAKFMWMVVSLIVLVATVRIFFRKLSIVEMEFVFGKKYFANLMIERKTRKTHLFSALCCVFPLPVFWIIWRRIQREPLFQKYNYFYK